MFFKRLEVIEVMGAFLAQKMGGNEELRSKMEQAESNLVAAQKAVADGTESLKKAKEEREVANAEARWLTEEGEAIEARYRKVKQEKEWLKKEMEEFWARFVAQKKKLKGEYQKQVDDMFFFDYQ